MSTHEVVRLLALERLSEAFDDPSLGPVLVKALRLLAAEGFLAQQVTYRQVEVAAKNLISETFVWINSGDGDELVSAARQRLVRSFADELGLTLWRDS